MSTLLGKTSDGRELCYDASFYEFWLDDERADFADVRKLDLHNWVHWRAPELRDWFRRIDARDLDACNRRARKRALPAEGDTSSSSRARPQAATHAAALAAAAQAAVKAAELKRAQAFADSKLRYRSTNTSVATVDDEGIVRVTGSGQADIFAHRVGPGGNGPEMRVVTIAIEDNEFGSNEVEPLETSLQKVSHRSVTDEEVIRMPSATLPPTAIASNAVQSYKSKRGVLNKDKKFKLETHMSYEPMYRKLEGCPFIEVQATGEVLVRKGLKSGLYTAKVAVLPADGGNVGQGEIISVSVKIR